MFSQFRTYSHAHTLGTWSTSVALIAAAGQRENVWRGPRFKLVERVQNGNLNLSGGCGGCNGETVPDGVTDEKDDGVGGSICASFLIM